MDYLMKVDYLTKSVPFRRFYEALISVSSIGDYKEKILGFLLNGEESHFPEEYKSGILGDSWVENCAKVAKNLNSSIDDFKDVVPNKFRNELGWGDPELFRLKSRCDRASRERLKQLRAEDSMCHSLAG